MASNFLLTFPETIKHGTGGGDDRQRAQYQRNNQFQIHVDGRVLRNVVIDLHRRHGAASVRLKCRDPVFGDRETRVIVRPYSNVVRSSRLQLAERVRLLYLNDKSHRCLPLYREFASLQSPACTFSSNRHESTLQKLRVNYFVFN